MSLYPVTPSVRPKEYGFAFSLVGSPPFRSEPSGNQLHARSYLTAPCSVRRRIVHWSCAYSPCHSVRFAVFQGPMRSLNEMGCPARKVYVNWVSFTRLCWLSSAIDPWYPILKLCAPVT